MFNQILVISIVTCDPKFEYIKSNIYILRQLGYLDRSFTELNV